MPKIDFDKSKKIYYTIKEVASHFDVKESLLRFWETEFKEIKPRKTEGGSRQYKKSDIETIAVIYHLVKVVGLTLEGARQTLRVKKNEEERRLEVLRYLEKIKKELNDIRGEMEIED